MREYPKFIMTDLYYVLEVIGYKEDGINLVIKGSRNPQRILFYEERTYIDMGFTAGTAKELILYNNWYVTWKNTIGSEVQTLHEAFTRNVWDNYLLDIATKQVMKRSSMSITSFASHGEPNTTIKKESLMKMKSEEIK